GHAGGAQVGHRGDAGSVLAVRHRAVGDSHGSSCHQLDVVLGDPHAVGCHHPGGVEDPQRVQVSGHRDTVPFGDGVAFGATLGEMDVDVEAPIGGQLGGGPQRLLGQGVTGVGADADGDGGVVSVLVGYVGH